MKIFIALLLSLQLFGSVKQNMLNYYQNNKFEKACNIGFKNFSRHTKDEDFLSMYAFSCLQADYIDRLALPTTMLKYSQEARANSAYFSVILMQKKLLYHALIDDYDLSQFNLPTTDYILSKVFEFYAKLGQHERRSLYIFDDIGNPKVTYKLYLEREYKVSKMVIEEYYDDTMMKRHIYW